MSHARFQNHPSWNEARNPHFFTATVLQDAGTLLQHVAAHNMIMVLPRDNPTLEMMSTKNWTRPDIVFCSANAKELIVTYGTDPNHRAPSTDHVPIPTIPELPISRKTPQYSYNFRVAGWEAFRKELAIRLEDVPDRSKITTETQFKEAVEALTGALYARCRSHHGLTFQT